MRVAQWIELSVGALGNVGFPKLAGCLKHQLQQWGSFLAFFSFSEHSAENSMRVAQWIELSVGTLGNVGVPKLARCLKHQLQQWAHFLIFYHFHNILVNFYVCGSMD
jgi:hypothetical protein